MQYKCLFMGYYSLKGGVLKKSAFYVIEIAEVNIFWNLIYLYVVGNDVTHAICR